MKLTGCNVLVKEDIKYPKNFIVEINELDDSWTRDEAWKIREQILENQTDVDNWIQFTKVTPHIYRKESIHDETCLECGFPKKFHNELINPIIEKAEKWDNIRRDMTCVDNPELRTLLYQLEQEIKQLKEKATVLENQYIHDKQIIEEQSIHINHLRRMLNSQEK